MNRLTWLVGGAAVSFGVLYATYAADLVGWFALDDHQPTGMSVASNSESAALGAQGPVSTPLPSSPAPSGERELLPGHESPLWPIPTFVDGCSSKDAGGTSRGGESGAAPCDQGVDLARPRPTHWGPVLESAGAVVILALLVGGAAGGWRVVALRREQTSRRADQLRRWRIATLALGETESALVAFEMDADAERLRPLLADVTEPATAAFHTAYDAARALRAPVIPYDDAAINRFMAAAMTAQRAFESADINARSKSSANPGGQHGAGFLPARTLTEPTEY